MPDQPSAEDPGVPRWAFVGGVFALVAITLEVWGSWGTGADPRPPMSWLVPSGWPMAIRVGWWLLAAAGTVAANRGLAVATGRSRRVATAVTAWKLIGADWVSLPTDRRWEQVVRAIWLKDHVAFSADVRIER